VKEFLDSGPVAGDRDEVMARLRRDGYLFLRGLVSVDEVRLAAGELLDELADRRWLRRGDREGQLNGLFRWAGPSMKEFNRVYASLQSKESVHRLVGCDAVRRVVESLLGPAVVHPHRIIRTTLPVKAGGPDDPSIHRDYLNWRIPDMLTVWMPLLPCSRERGSLAVLAGSHLAGVGYPNTFDTPSDWVTGDFDPGDVILFHCYTVHGVLPNESPLLRLSIDSRWQSLAHPVPEWVCGPDGGGNWDDYTGSWTDDRWIRVPQTADILPNQPGQVDPPLVGLPESALLAGPRAS
jgi:hypothetical protein